MTGNKKLEDIPQRARDDEPDKGNTAIFYNGMGRYRGQHVGKPTMFARLPAPAELDVTGVGERGGTFEQFKTMLVKEGKQRFDVLIFRE